MSEVVLRRKQPSPPSGSRRLGGDGRDSRRIVHCTLLVYTLYVNISGFQHNHGSSKCSHERPGMQQLPLMGPAILHHKHEWRRCPAHGRPEATLLKAC